VDLDAFVPPAELAQLARQVHHGQGLDRADRHPAPGETHGRGHQPVRDGQQRPTGLGQQDAAAGAFEQ
jgi:hypothetical protein